MTEDDIRRIIGKSSNASCQQDPLPTWLLKRSLDALCPVITKIVNLSLQSGCFPSTFKSAIVKPLIKKSTLDPELLKNYRPVSNLTFVSKIIEKAVAAQLKTYMDGNSLTEKYQSAYKECHSTETALLNVKDDIMRSIDRGCAVVLVLLDLSAAFDTVDYSMLCDMLRSRLGVTGTVLKWIQSYLHQRTQTVSIGQAFSEVLLLLFGVPQGSVLGPLLFTIYAMPLADIARRYRISFHSYADDTQLYIEFSPQIQLDSESIARLEQCIVDIRAWMRRYKLKLNDDKSEVLLLSTSYQHKHSLSHGIDTIGDTKITSASCAKNLGVIFDKCLDMDDNVKNICKLAYFQLRQIRSIQPVLSRVALERVIHAFITSRLDYCNSLLCGISEQQLTKLQRLQIVAARILTGTKKRDHITPVLKALHWLPVKYRIQYKVLLLVFRTRIGQAPPYMNEMLQEKTCSRALRSSDASLLHVAKTRTK